MHRWLNLLETSYLLVRPRYGRKARAGLLLHTGRMVEWLTTDVLAAPCWRVP